jgi:hypothetical protein
VSQNHHEAESECYRQVRRRAVELAGVLEVSPWELGERLGMSEPAVADFLHGSGPISAYQLRRLAEALVCDAAWLLTGQPAATLDASVNERD